ncbi:MAG: multidrug transporter [Euryarchaeota archaeon]|nr:multidrug transporter [Euryarchaeota archaeon]
MPWLIKKLARAGIVGVDLHKPYRANVPKMGGLGILVGLIVAFSIGLVFQVFDLKKLAIVLSIILLAGTFGILDDLFDLNAKIKLSLPILFVIPLMLIYPSSAITLPSLTIDLDFSYWLLISIWLMIAINGTNMLAGLNGLEAGLGAIACFSLWIVSIFLRASESAFILVVSCGVLLASLWYNKYPAKIFPGNIGTSLIGVIIVVSAVVGKFEFLGLIVMIPYFIDMFLKFWTAKGILVRHQHLPTKVTNDGKLIAPAGSYLSLIRLFIQKDPLSEKEVVTRIWLIGIVFGILVVSLALMVR